MQKFIDLFKRHWKELFKFGLVGGAATGTHYFTALILIEWFHVDLHPANFFGFSAAFGVSYLGQSLFTFKTSFSWQKLIQYLLLQVSNYFISATTLEVLTAYFDLNHRIALLIVVMMMPLLSYFVSKRFIFKKVAKPL